MELKIGSVKFEMASGVADIKLAGQHNGNALNRSLVAGLKNALQQAVDAPACRAIVLSADGSDFCRGLDFDALLSEGFQIEILEAFLRSLMCICHAPVPVIACVQGNVTGGGVGLVAACDLVIAASHVTFMLPEVIVGLIPALVKPFLRRRMSAARIGYMALSTKGIDAEGAYHFGLVDKVVPQNPEAELTGQLQRLFRSSPQAVTTTKSYLNRESHIDLEELVQTARIELIDWLSRPEVIGVLKDFAVSKIPPWFDKYKG